MLIRLAGHFLLNPQHIDKLICIKGLPDDWMFRTRADGRKELKAPWEADIDENIPKHVRHVCVPKTVVKYYSPIEKGREGVTEELTILGVKLNYMTEPGRAMWTKIERYMEGTIPRDIQLPIPVLVAKDQKSPFETFTARKRVTGGLELEPSEIPVVDLDNPTGKIQPIIPQETHQATVLTPPSAPTAAKTPVEEFKCDQCKYSATKKQALRMHTTRLHKKEKVGV